MPAFKAAMRIWLGDPASESYVRAKQKASHELGFHSIQENQAADIVKIR